MPWLTAVLFGTTCIISYLWLTTLGDFERLRSEIERPQHAEYENRAVKVRADLEKVSQAVILRLSFPVTMELADRVCVELRSRSGVTDGGEVYCFDKRTKRIVERFEPQT